HCIMKTVGIIFNRDKLRARTDAEKLKAWLQEKGCRVVVVPASVKKPPRMDFVLCLGGDGTMLKASRLLAPARIPVLGINVGSLGFLAETDPEEAYLFIDNILRDGFQTEDRMMLSVTLRTRGRKLTQAALNDCIVHSGNNGRVITVSMKVDNEFLADYIGDGLIVATPTGSTAYSLAASGPIVHPHLSVFILTPICPHTMTQRPMIVSTHHTLSFRVDSSMMQQKPILSLDGQTSYLLNPDDLVTITVSPSPLRLIINPRRKYLQVLRTKLKWGERG
ncbi:MAG: NAD(+)/NADH kinase, partial [Endomicrobiales bacterium]